MTGEVTDKQYGRKLPYAGVLGTMAALVAVGAFWHYEDHNRNAHNNVHPGKKQVTADKYHDPKVAGMALAHRFGSCALTVHDTHKKPQAEPNSPEPPANDVIEYKLDLKLNKSVQPYYAAFANDNDVLWDDSIVFDRMHFAPQNGYTPLLPVEGPALFAKGYPTKDGVQTILADPQANGAHIDNSITTHLSYATGSFFDIWAGESTMAHLGDSTERVSVNAIYCGRIIMGDVDGVPTWQLDTSNPQPLQEPQEFWSNNKQDYYGLQLAKMWPNQAQPTPLSAANF